MRILGMDHPHTVISRGNLAYAYKQAGDPSRAIPQYEQALADSMRVLGENHPHTWACRHYLAATRQQTSVMPARRAY